MVSSAATALGGRLAQAAASCDANTVAQACTTAALAAASAITVMASPFLRVKITSTSLTATRLARANTAATKRAWMRSTAAPDWAPHHRTAAAQASTNR